MRRWRSTALQLLGFLLLYLLLRSWLQIDLASGTAPPLQGQTLQGTHFSLDTPRSQPLMIHFWASWCPVCKLEQSSIESIALETSTITVAMQSGEPLEVEHYMEQQQLHASTLNDPEGILAQRFGVTAVPATFILSPDNQIRFVERGFTSEWGLRLRIWLTHLFYSR